MYIKEIEIDSFGCLSHKSLTFDEGFNLIYGLNESGKSTLFAFVVFMFYGTKIKKIPGDLSFKDRYMPWSGEPMHGKIVFCHDGKTYIISRMYSELKNTVALYCTDTSEEIKDRRILSSPGEYFFGVSAEAFFRSTYICSMQEKHNSMSAHELVSKLTNTYETVSTEVSYGKITDIINNEISLLSSTKRKNAVIPSIEHKIFNCKQSIAQIRNAKDEVDRITLENSELDNDITKLEHELELLKSDSARIPESKRSINRIPIIITLIFLAISVVLLWLIPNKYTFAISGIILICFCVFGVCRIRTIKERRKADERKLFTIQTNNDKIVLLTEKIIAAKTEKIQNSERCRALSQGVAEADRLTSELQSLENELKENRTRLKALELALTALNRAFADFKSVFSPELSKMTGEILSSITDGKYTDTIVDEVLNVSVDGGYDYRSAAAFSQGTAEQIYFAMRVALSKILLSDDGAPLFLDDALAFYDDNRLKSALDFLIGVSKDTQVIFSTCRSTEQLILKDKGIKTFYFKREE